MRIVVSGNRAQAIVLNALLASQGSRRHFAMVQLADLRRRIGGELTRVQVDEALIALFKANVIVLQAHDWPASVSEEKRAQYLRVRDQYCFAANLRQ